MVKQAVKYIGMIGTLILVLIGGQQLVFEDSGEALPCGARWIPQTKIGDFSKEIPGWKKFGFYNCQYTDTFKWCKDLTRRGKDCKVVHVSNLTAVKSLIEDVAVSAFIETPDVYCWGYMDSCMDLPLTFKNPTEQNIVIHNLSHFNSLYNLDIEGLPSFKGTKALQEAYYYPLTQYWKMETVTIPETCFKNETVYDAVNKTNDIVKVNYKCPKIFQENRTWTGSTRTKFSSINFPLVIEPGEKLELFFNLRSWKRNNPQSYIKYGAGWQGYVKDPFINSTFLNISLVSDLNTNTDAAGRAHIIHSQNLSLRNSSLDEANIKAYWRFTNGSRVLDLQDRNGIIANLTIAGQIGFTNNAIYYGSGAQIVSGVKNAWWTNAPEIYDFIGNSSYCVGIRVKPDVNGAPVSNEWFANLYNGASLRRSLKRVTGGSNGIACCNDGGTCSSPTAAVNNQDNSTRIVACWVFPISCSVWINETLDSSQAMALTSDSGGAALNFTISAQNSGVDEFLRGTYADVWISKGLVGIGNFSSLMFRPPILFNASWHGNNLSGAMSSNTNGTFFMDCSGGLIGQQCVFNVTDANNGTRYANVTNYSSFIFSTFGGGNISVIVDILLQSGKDISTHNPTATFSAGVSCVAYFNILNITIDKTQVTQNGTANVTLTAGCVGCGNCTDDIFVDPEAQTTLLQQIVYENVKEMTAKGEDNRILDKAYNCEKFFSWPLMKQFYQCAEVKT